MLNLIKKALTVASDPNEGYRDLIRYEAKIGGRLFGPIPEKHDRQFFCLDEHAWVWHESWVDKYGRNRSVTTRYEVNNNGIFKVQANMPHRRLSDEEFRNFYQAVKLYSQRVTLELQRLAEQS